MKKKCCIEIFCIEIETLQILPQCNVNTYFSVFFKITHNNSESGNKFQTVICIKHV